MSNEGKLKKVDTNTEDEAVVKLSFVIALKIIKANKPFSDSEFIKDCLVEASRIVCPKEQQKFKNNSLSRKTVVQRLEIINENVQNQLKSVLKWELMWYSIALDETNYYTRLYLEVIEIYKHKENFNRLEETLKINLTWIPKTKTLPRKEQKEKPRPPVPELTKKELPAIHKYNLRSRANHQFTFSQH